MATPVDDLMPLSCLPCYGVSAMATPLLLLGFAVVLIARNGSVSELWVSPAQWQSWLCFGPVRKGSSATFGARFLWVVEVFCCGFSSAAVARVARALRAASYSLCGPCFRRDHFLARENHRRLWGPSSAVRIEPGPV